MNQKGFVNIILVILVVVLAGAVGYFTLYKKSVVPVMNTSSTQQTTSSQEQVPSGQTDLRSPNYKSLSKEEQRLLSKDTWSIQHLSQMRLALLFYYKDHKDFPQDISSIIPKYLPLTAEQRGAYNSDQFHYFRCSSETFHIGVSLTFNHDPVDLGSDNKAMWLASDLDKKVCANDPIQFGDNTKCLPSDIGNHCLDLGKDDFQLKTHY